MANFVSPYEKGYSKQEIPFSVCIRIPKEWKEVDCMARSSVGKIQCDGQSLGCGILIGIDRLLVPAHVINDKCTQNLSVNFYSTDGQTCTYTYGVLNFLIVNEALDFAILQLGSTWNRFPGSNHSFPDLSHKSSEKFLLGRFDDEHPYCDLVEGGYPCYKGNFCSFAGTNNGCSGSGYFDENGLLFAMHLSRSNDQCFGVPQGERKAILISEMMYSSNLAYHIFSIPRCQQMRPPQNRYVCLTYSYGSELCFVEEKKGGRSAFSGEITINGRTHNYWEWRPKNCKGGGPRGLTISIPHQRKKITYTFNINPHSINGYIGNEGPLYTSAAAILRNKFQFDNEIPNDFEFESHSRKFIASKSEEVSYR